MLNLYLKPTIVYTIEPVGTTTSIDINGTTISAFPHVENVFKDDLNTIVPNIDSDYSSGIWSSNYNTLLNGGALNNSFYGMYSDTLTLSLSKTTAFISGNDTVCDNSEGAYIKFDFNGTPPFTFGYSINSDNLNFITSQNTPYYLLTKQAGRYVLESFNDANGPGSTSGSGYVTVVNSPNANFTAFPDTLSISNTTVSLKDNSSPKESIISWEWNFGDNSGTSTDKNPYYTYAHEDLSQDKLYAVRLIVTDANSCLDTALKIITVTDDYWAWIPNSFSPDKDGINDKFCISYNLSLIHISEPTRPY